jgi:hypothetical protein
MDIDYLFDILEGSRTAEAENELINLYRRLLNTFDWYTLLKLIPEKHLKYALEDNVLSRLYPKDLSQRFKYARNILSRKTLSNSG